MVPFIDLTCTVNWRQLFWYSRDYYKSDILRRVGSRKLVYGFGTKVFPHLVCYHSYMWPPMMGIRQTCWVIIIIVLEIPAGSSHFGCITWDHPGALWPRITESRISFTVKKCHSVGAIFTVRCTAFGRGHRWTNRLCRWLFLHYQMNSDCCQFCFLFIQFVSLLRASSVVLLNMVAVEQVAGDYSVCDWATGLLLANSLY